MMPVPRVSVRKCERKPMSPRDGHRELEAHAAAADVVHAAHDAAAHAEELGDDADVLLGHVDQERAPSAPRARRRARATTTVGFETCSS